MDLSLKLFCRSSAFIHRVRADLLVFGGSLSIVKRISNDHLVVFILVRGSQSVKRIYPVYLVVLITV